MPLRAWGTRGSPYVLVYEDDSNILPRLRILLKGILDLSGVGLSVDDEEVPLRRGAGGHMLRGLDVSGDSTSFRGLSWLSSAETDGV